MYKNCTQNKNDKSRKLLNKIKVSMPWYRNLKSKNGFQIKMTFLAKKISKILTKKSSVDNRANLAGFFSAIWIMDSLIQIQNEFTTDVCVTLRKRVP